MLEGLLDDAREVYKVLSPALEMFSQTQETLSPVDIFCTPHYFLCRDVLQQSSDRTERAVMSFVMLGNVYFLSKAQSPLLSSMKEHVTRDFPDLPKIVRTYLNI